MTTTSLPDSTISLLENIAEISQKMKDAPTLATADPRFWVVQQKKWRPVPEGYGGEMFIWNGGSLSCSSPKEFATIWLEHEMEDWDDGEVTEDVKLGSSITMSLCDDGDWTNPYDWKITRLDESALQDDVYDGITPPGNEIIWRDWEWETVENTLFLSLEECERHIMLNAHHYNHPRTFCMRAWRSPDVEALWKALKGIDWDAVLGMVASKQH